MKAVRLSILLVVLAGMISIAAAGPVHTITGNFDETETTAFVLGGIVTDKVPPVYSPSFEMQFVWKDADGSVSRISEVSTLNSGYYVDYHAPETDGTWTITAKEYGVGGITKSYGVFQVAKLPEFAFGALVSLAIGGLYFTMRRRMVGSL